MAATMYTAECIRCGGTIGKAFLQLGDGEEALLRDHLTGCTKKAATRHSVLSVGDLLTQFRLTRIDAPIAAERTARAAPTSGAISSHAGQLPPLDGGDQAMVARWQ